MLNKYNSSLWKAFKNSSTFTIKITNIFTEVDQNTNPVLGVSFCVTLGTIKYSNRVLYRLITWNEYGMLRFMYNVCIINHYCTLNLFKSRKNPISETVTKIYTFIN